MTENKTITIGRSCQWRRDNLLKVHHCIERDTFWEVTFQYVEHMDHGVKQVNLTYKILK